MTEQMRALFETIESSNFRFAVNQASGFRSFKRLVREQEVYDELKRLVRGDDALAEGYRVVTRIRYLLSLDTDMRYENPYDAAIAAYLLALSTSQFPYVENIAHFVTSKPRFWWAAKVAYEVVAMEQREHELKAANVFTMHDTLSGGRYTAFQRSRDVADVLMSPTIPIVGGSYNTLIISGVSVESGNTGQPPSRSSSNVSSISEALH